MVNYCELDVGAWGMAGYEWTELALCARTDPERFFPELGGTATEARRICHQCVVREECLEFALRNNERYGIWGGLTQRERRDIQRGC
ncbi:WhiB family transcriptional regulator [Streptomyces sioyaensis]|uniref:WhiB family transcriptional regulator n=1 Tax=Streptomyces sioyaensis TaxID=67364 RepID=UPI003D734417